MRSSEGCVLVIGFGLGLARVGGANSSIGTAVAVVLVGVGLIIAGIFPIGMEHVGGALLIFLGLTAACLVVAFGRARAKRWGWAVYALASGVVVFASFRPYGSEELPWAPIAGLTQRASLITGFAFVLVLATWAARQPRERQARTEV